MYLRFTTQFTNPFGETETGIFLALRFLRDDYPATQNEDIARLKQISVWFNKHLEKPTRFSNAGNKNPANISLSWFKDSAKEHIRRIQQLIEIFQKYGIFIERISTKNPGYIVYEDEFQISAIPYKTDRNKVI